MTASRGPNDIADFELLFEASPDVLLVLLPDAPKYTMVAATKARFEATHTTKETLGRGLFELFPDNPDDPDATGTNNLRASLDRVVATRAADTMAVQKYDIRGPDGSFQSKYWSPKNIPVLAADGSVRYIIHRVEEVTELVRASELGEELRGRTRQMETEVIKRSAELASAVRELREANQKLGELDVAKTAFFSNVSHEFRTPLTLMLGPLEEMLSDAGGGLTAKQSERIALAHANALRLLKLVTALLDFSRIEAGRMDASYAPVDLARATRDIVMMFQSAFAAAGIELRLDTPALSEPVWVDRDMWEKIITNLVSNAFKFTFEGHIAVRLIEESSCIVLSVEDTGVGIPEDELPKVFDRFHRVTGTVGRTHEGTGIGLSLVRELAMLHGGQVSASSAVGKGTTFRVTLPKGFAHLPARQVSQEPKRGAVLRNVEAHAAEISRWGARSVDRHEARPNVTIASGPRAQVLVVDDNADLREYIAELVAPHYEVRTAVDGVAALENIRAQPPDIVVSDVMMPRLDGMGLVKALRADKLTANIPVILLSARAGEEATVEGLDIGADDYLVKPFAARELLARVATHLTLASNRRAWSAELSRANQELEAHNEELRAQDEELRAQSAELHHQRAQLIEANAQLARASRQKSDFLSSMSHELRTPLNAVIGFSELLLSGDDLRAPATKRNVEDILAAGRQLLTLVNDILDLAKIEAGRTDVRISSFDLEGAVRDACSLAVPLAHRRGVQLVNRVAASELYASADPDRTKQVLLNLVANAVKFTPEGGSVTVSARRTDEHLRIEITDTGIGIAPDDAARLFQPFSQLTASGEMMKEGTGLGLAISRHLVELMHGEIGLSSRVGAGSTFFFTLPVGSAVPRAPAPALRRDPDVGSSYVLLVEDDPASVRVTASVLGRAGYRVVVASTSGEALALARAERPKFFIVDLVLPGVSGFELIEALRAESTFSQVPIAVFTARDLSKEERTRLDNSADLVAQKGSLTEEGFVAALGSLARKVIRKLVLCVDDNAVNRRVVRAMLTPEGYEVIEVDGGRAALVSARERQPDVILMDLRMPDLDGLEATRLLAADKATASIPVIALTAQAMTGDRETALAAGCAAYLSKPVARRQLLATIESVLARTPPTGSTAPE